MSKFLDNFVMTMPESQRKKLLELLEQRKNDGLIKSESEFKIELERLMGDLEERDGTPTFLAIKQDDRIESKIHNQNMEDILFDLSSIFESSNQIDRLLGSHHQLSKSSIGEIRKRIEDMRSSVQLYQLLLADQEGATSGIIEQFLSPRYTETNEELLEHFRRDRFGEAKPKELDAEAVGGSLQLASIESTDQLKTRYGRRIADIKVVNRVGLQAENTKYPIENAIDGSLDTFWAESVLVDDLITQDIDKLWSHDHHDFPKDGAICEVEILLNGLSTISELSFDPFSSYPLEVVSIVGYENENKTGESYDLISPNHQNPYQRSQKSVSRMVFQFPSVEVSVIRLLIRQENYTKENFLINQDDLDDSRMWDRLTNDEHLIRDYAEPGETVASLDKKNEISGWTAYLKGLEEWAEKTKSESLLESAKKALEVIRLGDYKNPLLLTLLAMSPDGTKQEIDQEEIEDELNKKWKPVNKLNYLYGAYDISLYGRKYQRSSFYVTEELPISRNTEKIALVTEERHQYVSVGPDEIDADTDQAIPNSAKITDIEYYITDKSNPTTFDWIPLLPEGQKYVEGELLFGDDETLSCADLNRGNTINFSFRFNYVSRETVTIRRNGIPMDPDMYILCESGRKVGIKDEFYSATSIYTADYKPTEDAYYVNLGSDLDVSPTQFINKNGEVGEFFSELDQNNAIQLSNYPYLHRDFLYSYQGESGYVDDKDTLKASEFKYPVIVRVNGEEYKNVTDYTTNSYDPARLNENNGKTFVQIKDRIIFGQPKDEIKNIYVDYYHMTSSVRMKIIFRRNHAGYESITPSLRKYTIKAKSFDQNK